MDATTEANRWAAAWRRAWEGQDVEAIVALHGRRQPPVGWGPRRERAAPGVACRLAVTL